MKFLQIELVPSFADHNVPRDVAINLEEFQRHADGLPGIGGTTTAHVLSVVLDARSGGFHFLWSDAITLEQAATGFLNQPERRHFGSFGLVWTFRIGERQEADFCAADPSAVNTLLKRIAHRLPLVKSPPTLAFNLAKPSGRFRAETLHMVDLPKDVDFWKSNGWSCQWIRQHYPFNGGRVSILECADRPRGDLLILLIGITDRNY